jgi:hypothetical protein
MIRVLSLSAALPFPSSTVPSTHSTLDRQKVGELCSASQCSAMQCNSTVQLHCSAVHPSLPQPPSLGNGRLPNGHCAHVLQMEDRLSAMSSRASLRGSVTI